MREQLPDQNLTPEQIKVIAKAWWKAYSGPGATRDARTTAAIRAAKEALEKTR